MGQRQVTDALIEHEPQNGQRIADRVAALDADQTADLALGERLHHL